MASPGIRPNKYDFFYLTAANRTAHQVIIRWWRAAGAGDRLGLVCDQTGEPLPAAMLPYCGRPLLEGLVRDLTAREYLYYRTFGEQCITPVAIMTSDAKGNDRCSPFPLCCDVYMHCIAHGNTARII